MFLTNRDIHCLVLSVRNLIYASKLTRRGIPNDCTPFPMQLNKYMLNPTIQQDCRYSACFFVRGQNSRLTKIAQEIGQKYLKRGSHKRKMPTSQKIESTYKFAHTNMKFLAQSPLNFARTHVCVSVKFKNSARLL